MKAQPTLGPWTEFQDGDSHDIIGPDGFHIASMEPGHEKDAALIAAAPDLLAALKYAVLCVKYCRQNHEDAQKGEGVPVEMVWEEIIAKAEGRS